MDANMTVPLMIHLLHQVRSWHHRLVVVEEDEDDDDHHVNNPPSIIDRSTVGSIVRLRKLRHRLLQLQDAVMSGLETMTKEQRIMFASSTTAVTKTVATANTARGVTLILLSQLDALASSLLNIVQQEYWFIREEQGDTTATETKSSWSATSATATTTTTASPDTKNMIRQSLSYTCMQHASLVLKSLWKLRQRIIANNNNSIVRGKCTDASAAALQEWYHKDSIHKMVLPSLISFAMAISSLEIVDAVEKEDEDTTTISARGGGCRTSSRRCQDFVLPLDRGEDCALVILSCIRFFLCCYRDINDSIDNVDDDIIIGYDDMSSCCDGISCLRIPEEGDVSSSSSSSSSSLPPQHLLSQEVGSAMNGGLVARLVQGCLSLLVLSSSNPSLSSSSSSNAHFRKNEYCVLQIEALKTLRTLMNRIVPSSDLWKSILPGGFAKLYKLSILHLQQQPQCFNRMDWRFPTRMTTTTASSSSSSSSSFIRVTAESVRVLALLLDNSLSTKRMSKKDKCVATKVVAAVAATSVSNDGNKSILSITNSLMAVVNTHASKRTQHLDKIDEWEGKPLISLQEDEDNEDDTTKMDELELKKEVNHRLFGPLLVLINLLYTNRCKDVLKSGLYLHRTIMIQTRNIWTESNLIVLERKSLEFCLMMIVGDEEEEKHQQHQQQQQQQQCTDGDSDARHLKHLAYQLLRSYKAYYHPYNDWKKKLCISIVPKILELLEELPVLARSRREMQVRENLRLINGYLVLSFHGFLHDESDDDRSSSSSWKKLGKSDIRHALSCSEALGIVKDTFSVLFEPDVDAISLTTIISIKSTLSPDLNEIDLLNHNNYVPDRFLYLGDEAVRATKRTVQLVAQVLGGKRCAFLIDECIANLYQSFSQSHQASHNEIVHRRQRWSGLCIFVSQLLRGIDCYSKVSTSMNNIFSSLASSIFPLIVSDPLWTLPTVLHSEATRDNNKWNGQSHNVAGATSGLEQKYNHIMSDDQVCKVPSASIMNCNAVLVTTMMVVIREFTKVLGGKIALHVPIILFPILERASPIGNHSTVQRAAIATLRAISETAGCHDISLLIASNFDYLADILSQKLRRYGKERTQMEHSCVGVLDFILCSIIHNRVTENSDNDGPVSLASNLLNCFLNYFDRQPIMTNLSVLDAMMSLRSMCTFMDSSIDVHLSNIETIAVDDDDYDWFQRLDFELTAESTGQLADDCFENDIASSAHSDINDSVQDADESLRGGTHNTQKYDRDEMNGMQEVIAINTILSRCGYILCYPNLKIQVLCCETIRTGFHSLGKVGSVQKKIHGEASSNPIFRAIAEFWPSIISRFRAASKSFTSMNKLLSRSELSTCCIMDNDQSQGSHSQLELEVLLSNLLYVIAELCISSDGFFADRFEQDAFPIIATLMSALLSNTTCQLAEHKQTLLISILHCLKCAFESECRHCLSGLIPTAGAMLLPLLAFEEGSIGLGAVSALKAMLVVDSDALWRDLHNLSGNPFPCNPIDISSSSASTIPLTHSTIIVIDTLSNTIQRRMNIDFVLSEKAKELLDFAESIPEYAL